MKKNLSRTVWGCKYHIVWAPNNRCKIMYGKVKEEIEDKDDSDLSNPFYGS
ncbi:MAG: transposase [Candidatus Scalindua rubra]|uniref:Transposase IS200-like domain-containing protein n=1 Tax=Candidatus Scalindua brodae TaxID=237368 RepID=A0A0B0ER43_9BACT|nr:MAG: hypothetical protein SCABRO_01064 [Candidatus Scalindua brodae]MBZ0108633.1 transposase [Candidatus Scalindua rubra]TWU38005.1 hypothetical protein S225a_00510 [Candidatus Brocadiaceae bacterium S225]